MKILGISAGTRNGGNDGMCREALMGAAEMGAEVEFINLFDLDIKHCTGCVACVNALFSGKGCICSQRDDFDWLLDKMMDADGIVFAVPIFEKGAPGIFHTIMDRFGPRLDRGNLTVATQIAQQTGGKAPDPRFLKDKVVSYMGIGGSDWMTRVECDFGIQALTPMWKIIDNAVFSWSLGILADDEKVAKAHQIGVNLANAAKDIANAQYQGEPGICPHCHSREFYFDRDGSVVCCQCGIIGKMVCDEKGYSFQFPDEQLPHAHDTLDGKFIHADDINRNNTRANALHQSQKYKDRVAAYKAFVPNSKPEKKA
jgi:NAD(P)H-dependent FMN reductase/uncharacterized Zn finger protein (UPF0148 family)